MEIILLEKIEKLGNLGETVTVKPGFARNFLLPKGKALRATKANIEYFEAQKTSLKEANAERKVTAEGVAKKIDGKIIVLIRSASDAGQLYGSVTTRDIASALSEVSGETITRNNVVMENPVKSIGFFNFTISLHPEVATQITVNVAQSEEEAKLQADRVARGESAVITAAEEDARIAAEIALQQAESLKESAKEAQDEEDIEQEAMAETV